MYDGQNLLEVPNTTVNIFARHVARILWKHDELANNRFEGYEKKKTNRVIFNRKEDLEKIELLKSILFLYIYFFIYLF
jgi:hypothetical protein